MGALKMAGKLDEISEAIGGIRSDLKAMDRNIGENRRVQDERHTENKGRLDKIEETLSALASDRRVAVVIISIITGAIMWVTGHFATAFLARWK